MPTCTLRFIFTCMLTLCLAGLLQAQEIPNSDNKPLMVGVAGDAPFVIFEPSSKSLQGISIDIWQYIAEEENLLYQYQHFDSVSTALTALQEGKVDLVVGPISITSNRIEHFRFSQPYYQSSLTIASRNEGLSLWAKIKPFFSLKLLAATGIFLSILACVGLLLWLAEYKRSPEQFPSDPKRGIGNGMWLAIVTMSTTGYGDMAPVTLKGRIIAGSWMVISLIFATSMIAGISSTLTLSSFNNSTINQVEQLPGKKVAVVPGSPAEAFVEEHQGKIVAVTTLAEGMAKLNNKTIDAVVFDRPQLLFYKNMHKSENINIPAAEYYKQGYGFAFRTDSTLVDSTNLTLLKLSENQRVEAIFTDYLGKYQ